MGWHPCLRCDPDLTFGPEGQSEARPAAAWGGGEGTLWVGRGVASPRHSPLPGTLVVLHGRGHEHPWVLLTDTPPQRTDATLYACRDWIEQGFRGLKRAGWQWQRTRRTDPVRAGRRWLVLAVATLLAVAHGTRREEAAALGRNPARLRSPPASQPPAPGHGLPRGPAGPGTLVDAALAAAPARSLRASDRPRPGPGTLTHSSASVAHNPRHRPRGHTPRGPPCMPPTQPKRAHSCPRGLSTRCAATARCTPAVRTSLAAACTPYPEPHISLSPPPNLDCVLITTPCKHLPSQTGILANNENW
ncbi:MAG: hypothetical protein F4X83_03430 [Chloroflexi bacterium]|nr:hypothetical protein [Chloroflexota bacterium]